MGSMNVIELLREIEGKCNIVEEIYRKIVEGIYYHDKLTDKEKDEIEKWFELMRGRFNKEL